mgnify:FL=1
MSIARWELAATLLTDNIAHVAKDQKATAASFSNARIQANSVYKNGEVFTRLSARLPEVAATGIESVENIIHREIAPIVARIDSLSATAEALVHAAKRECSIVLTEAGNE